MTHFLWPIVLTLYTLTGSAHTVATTAHQDAYASQYSGMPLIMRGIRDGSTATIWGGATYIGAVELNRYHKDHPKKAIGLTLALSAGFAWQAQDQWREHYPH